MIEKLARAMLPALGYAPDADWERIWIGNNVDSAETGSLAFMCRDIARACLEALREPSEAMLQTGANGWREVFDEDDLRSIWQSMIDVALERKAA